jgi:polar amino acid transport system substrate-binding protein
VPAVARLIAFRGLLCAAIVAVFALSGGPSPAEPLRLITDIYSGPAENLSGPAESIANLGSPGFSLEVVRQVFAAMGRDVSFEFFPRNRARILILRGERDGVFPKFRYGDPICSYPDEPLGQSRSVFFVRTADVDKLKFSSFNDLLGHDVAIADFSNQSGSLEQAGLAPELWKFLREHHNMVETSDTIESLRMLAAGRVDYAVLNLNYGMRVIQTIGFSGKVEPLLSGIALDDAFYVCFTKARVSPALVAVFSRALKQFKQTEAYQAIYAKYLP